MNHHSHETRNQHIGILGGGITGLTAAFYLLRAGAKVTVLDAGEQPGGLSTYFDFGPFHWDKFYHCILTSDRPLHSLIEDLGLTDRMRWTETKVGFYANRQLHSLSSTADFLRFPPLSLWEKFRLGLGVMYASRIRDGRALEAIPVADWLIRVFGRGNYEKLWSPLLKCKLGACREEASAAFIWATIFRLNSTRDRASGRRERLGYVEGGYRTVFSRMLEEIQRMGGQVLTNVKVQEVRGCADGSVDFLVPGGHLNFDRALLTVPSHVSASITPGLDPEYTRKLRAVKYLGMVCAVLILKRRLTPYYVTNFADHGVPFTGVIEMTNLISTDETDGRHLVYLPKYIAPGDPLFEAADADVWRLFLSHLKKICPDLRDTDVERHFIFREKLVQPLPVLHYSDIVPSVETNIPNLFLANTTQIVNSTLNNNEMVKIARKAVDHVLSAPSDPTHCAPPIVAVGDVRS
jgi:protoporphyrinogen oxidase